MDLTIFVTDGQLIRGVGYFPVLALLLPGVPILAASIVLTWHGLRGSDPGPAAQLLLQLTRLILRRDRCCGTTPTTATGRRDAIADEVRVILARVPTATSDR